MRTFLGMSLLLLACAAALAGCIPRPDDPVEWVERPDAILVQMVDVVGLPQSELLDRLSLPVFTLYGDGTLIFVPPEEREQFPAPGQTLLRAEIPEQAVRELLEGIVDEGFLEFAYDQDRPGSRYDFSTTFLYVHTKTEANAVSAYALGSPPPPDDGEQWDEFLRLVKIKERLDAFDPAALGGRIVGEYQPEEFLLLVQPSASQDVPGEATVWPLTDVDLASIAAPGSGIVERRLSPTEASALMAALSSRSGTFRQGERFFDIGLRPLLPFEEHFPEFDQ
jgi:hypothetical protein